MTLLSLVFILVGVARLIGVGLDALRGPTPRDIYDVPVFILCILLGIVMGYLRLKVFLERRYENEERPNT